MAYSNSQRLRKNERLNVKEVSQLFSKSESAKGKFFVVRAAKNSFNYSRIAPIASKKAGKANKRNTIKRKIRAAFRNNKHCLPKGYDLAIIALYGVIDANYTELVRSLKDVTEKACNLCTKNTSKDSNADN